MASSWSLLFPWGTKHRNSLSLALKGPICTWITSLMTPCLCYQVVAGSFHWKRQIGNEIWYNTTQNIQSSRSRLSVRVLIGMTKGIYLSAVTVKYWSWWYPTYLIIKDLKCDMAYQKKHCQLYYSITLLICNAWVYFYSVCRLRSIPWKNIQLPAKNTNKLILDVMTFEKSFDGELVL